MFIAFLGMVTIFVHCLGFKVNIFPDLATLGFGLIGFDLVNELTALKTQVWAVGKAIVEEMEEYRKYVKRKNN